MAKKMITVTQVGSPIANTDRKRREATLTGLGLGRPGYTKQLIDSPQVRGMIAKVAHLVEVTEETK